MMRSFAFSMLFSVAFIGQMFAGVGEPSVRQEQPTVRPKVSIASAKNVAVSNVSVVKIEEKTTLSIQSPPFLKKRLES